MDDKKLNKDIIYRELREDETKKELFLQFHRHQKVTKCRRKIEGVWVVEEDSFIDDWKEEDYIFLTACLKNTIKTGGVVYGAFFRGQLKGFASVEAEPFGKKREYLDLSCIHASEEMRGKGIGRELFSLASEWARVHGAEKLYISAHSALETQAFYQAMGCVEAEEYHQKHVDKEPYDCQLECRL